MWPNGTEEAKIDWDRVYWLRCHPAEEGPPQTPSTGLRHPSLEEGAGKRCSAAECGPAAASELLQRFSKFILDGRASLCRQQKLARRSRLQKQYLYSVARLTEAVKTWEFLQVSTPTPASTLLPVEITLPSSLPPSQSLSLPPASPPHSLSPTPPQSCISSRKPIRQWLHWHWLATTEKRKLLEYDRGCAETGLTWRVNGSAWDLFCCWFPPLKNNNRKQNETAATESASCRITEHTRVYLWWSFEDVPLVEFTDWCPYMQGGSYCRRLRSLLLHLCYVFRAPINSPECQCWLVKYREGRVFVCFVLRWSVIIGIQSLSFFPNLK